MPKYPGLGLPLRHYPQEYGRQYPMGTHGNCRGSQSQLLPIREVAMMNIMDTLTDKPEWHKKVFNGKIVEKWRQEALSIPDEDLWRQAVGGKRQAPDEEVGMDYRLKPLMDILTSDVFDFCVLELQNKARYYEKSGIIPTLDATAGAAKSDTIVGPELAAALRDAFAKLKADQAGSPDWHPTTNGQVRNLVHPSMYPLVYGKSRVVPENAVGVHDAVKKWAGKGTVIRSPPPQPEPRYGFSYGVGGSTLPKELWSDTYQWLPARMAFQDDGRLKFTSYINNLHPGKYPDIYETIEKLVETSLPLWDQCLRLVMGYNDNVGAGRGVSRFPLTENPEDDNEENWTPDKESVADIDVDLGSDYGSDYFDSDDPDSMAEKLDLKWESLRQAVQPLPMEFKEIDYEPTAKIAHKFQKSGLQVIVKMASIELTPEQPTLPAGSWHVEGQMNEKICATALYYLDSENITSSSLNFRMQTSAYLEDEAPYDVGQDQYHWLEDVHGTQLGGGCGSPCLQTYGSVKTPQGRLLAFPNVFQHCVSSFKLQDPTKPGHRRFIALWLVDPLNKVISTSNIPPQQADWWLDSVFGNTAESKKATLSKLPAELIAILEARGVLKNEGLNEKEIKLPAELFEMVRGHFDDEPGLMTRKEAEEHRLELMKGRTTFLKTAKDGWMDHTYSFCEH